MFRLLRAGRLVRVTQPHSPVVPCTPRGLKYSIPALKKKRAASAFEEDQEFDDEPVEDDLFGASSESATASSTSKSTLRQLSEAASAASAEDRHARFLSELESISRFCGRVPSTRYTPRRRALLQLVILTHSKDEVDTLVETIILWRESRRQIDAQTSEEIIGRLVNLGYPEVALKLVANRAKFGVDIPSIATARTLLHSLVERARTSLRSTPTTLELQPTVTSSAFTDALLLAALYPQFRLPDIAEDIVSSAMLLSLRDAIGDGPEKKKVNALLKELQEKVAVKGQASLAPNSQRQKTWAAPGMQYLPKKLRKENTVRT